MQDRPPSPPLRALRVVAQVARFERYGDAAQALGVTTSAVSQQIRALETWIGTPLFERKTKSPRLTPAGQALVDGISEPLARIDQTCRALRRANDHQTVVVSAPAAYLSYRLIPALHRFWEEHPEIHVDVRIAPRFDGPPDNADADLSIRFLHDHPDAPALGRRGWRAVCHQTYFEAQGRPDSLAGFTEGIFLHESIYNFWPKVFEEAGLTLPKQSQYRGVGDASHVIAAAVAGNAMALVPAELTRQFVRDGTLVSPVAVGIEPRAAYFAFSGPETTKLATDLLFKFLHTDE